MSILLKMHRNFQLPLKTILRDKFLSTLTRFEYLLTLEQKYSFVALNKLIMGFITQISTFRSQDILNFCNRFNLKEQLFLVLHTKTAQLPLSRSCRPILDGFKAAQLKIITTDKNKTLFKTVKIMTGETEDFS